MGVSVLEFEIYTSRDASNDTMNACRWPKQEEKDVSEFQATWGIFRGASEIKQCRCVTLDKNVIL